VAGHQLLGPRIRPRWHVPRIASATCGSALLGTSQSSPCPVGPAHPSEGRPPPPGIRAAPHHVAEAPIGVSGESADEGQGQEREAGFPGMRCGQRQGQPLLPARLRPRALPCLQQYFTLSVDGQENCDAAWCCADPAPAAEQIHSHVTFWNDVGPVAHTWTTSEATKPSRGASPGVASTTPSSVRRPPRSGPLRGHVARSPCTSRHGIRPP